MPGPLPEASRRRRNAPTVSTFQLPAEGRTDSAPDLPAAYPLGEAGQEWWNWAWRLPQATKWDDGAVFIVARRAQLEDDRASLNFDDHLDLADLLAGADPEAIKNVEWALSMLKRSATGEVALMKEMRELDDRLGLNPKALAALRWTIADKPEGVEGKPGELAKLDDYRELYGTG